MYIENPDEDQNKQYQTSNTPSVGAGGGSGNTASGGNPSTIQPITSNQPSQSFANVQDYLNANKSQGEELGQKFSSSLQGTQEKEKQAVDTSLQGVKNQVQSASAYNPNIVNKALETPSEILGNPENYAQFQKQWNATYSGPSSFETSDQYLPATTAANEAVQTGKELGTTGGREQLLQDRFNVYGQGNKGLDQALLQNSSTYKDIPPLAQNFQSVQDYLKSQSDLFNTGTVPLAQQQVKNNATQAQQDFNAGITNYEKALNTEATSPISNNMDIWNAVSREYANLPGFSAPITTTPGVDIARYLNATPEERAKYSQFLQLANKQNTFLPTYANTPEMGELQAIYNSLRNR